MIRAYATRWRDREGGYAHAYLHLGPVVFLLNKTPWEHWDYRIGWDRVWVKVRL